MITCSYDTGPSRPSSKPPLLIEGGRGHSGTPSLSDRGTHPPGAWAYWACCACARTTVLDKSSPSLELLDPSLRRWPIPMDGTLGVDGGRRRPEETATPNGIPKGAGSKGTGGGGKAHAQARALAPQSTSSPWVSPARPVALGSRHLAPLPIKDDATSASATARPRGRAA
jgi:hypothetical protein